jgi:hypothetical protein
VEAERSGEEYLDNDFTARFLKLEKLWFICLKNAWYGWIWSKRYFKQGMTDVFSGMLIK